MSSIEVSESRGVRYLHFGSDLVQGAMRIARPWSLELEYTREMMFPLLLRPARAWPRSVLQVGLGSASFTRFLHRHRPRAHLTVVEILPEVVAAARQAFRLPEESALLRIAIGDASDFLLRTKRRFDLILVDGFDEEGRAGMLETLPFYLNCRSRLTAGGMMSANLLTQRRSVATIVQRIREAFEDRVIVLPPSGDGNTIAIAAADRDLETPPGPLVKAAQMLKRQTGLNLAPAVARLVAGQKAN